MIGRHWNISRVVTLEALTLMNCKDASASYLGSDMLLRRLLAGATWNSRRRRNDAAGANIMRCRAKFYRADAQVLRLESQR